MATVATRRENNDVPRTATRIDLTPTGLLMEGDFTNLRCLFALFLAFQTFGWEVS